MCGSEQDAKGNKLKNIGLSSTHTRLSTHLAWHRALFCKGQLPRGRWSAKHLTARHPQRSHRHCSQLQNNPSCASATTSASLPEGTSYNTSTMCTYKGKGSSRQSHSTWWECATRSATRSATSPAHSEEGSTAEGIKDSTTCKLPGGKRWNGIRTESQQSRFLGKSI